MKYIIDFDVFETAMIYVADDSYRPALRGVRLCKNRVEATNGHVGYMAIVSKERDLPEQVTGSIILPDVIVRPKNKLPSKTKKNWFTYCAITLGDDPRIEYVDFYGNTLAMDSLEVIDGKFPALSKLMSNHHKQEKQLGEFGLNADYLAMFAKALKRERFSTVRFDVKASDKSVMCSFFRPHLHDVKERVLMMPVRL